MWYNVDTKGGDNMDVKPHKDAVIRLRLTKRLKDDFQTKCDKFSVNPSDLIRKWIEKYTYKE
jgi:antitoxin component of RelBE/YafQ-DinJ toxin-antitoxin module